MNDEAKKRPWEWIWLAPATLAIYLLAYLPFVIALNWIIHWDLLSNGTATDVYDITYAPIIWGAEHSCWSIQWVNGFVKPFVPHH
jgi:hypothetical protein